MGLRKVARGAWPTDNRVLPSTICHRWRGHVTSSFRASSGAGGYRGPGRSAKELDPTDIAARVRAEPTGSFSRRAWFLYETFTGRTLDLEDARMGNYVEALDPERHIVANRRNIPPHRVVDNLLGGALASVRRCAEPPALSSKWACMSMSRHAR